MDRVNQLASITQRDARTIRRRIDESLTVLATVAERSAECRSVASQDEPVAATAHPEGQRPEFNTAINDAVAKLLTALENTPDAIIQIGSVLLIKIDGVPHVCNLLQLELARMERNLALFRDPAALLELQDD